MQVYLQGLFLLASYLLQVAFSPPQATPSAEERRLKKESVYTKSEKLHVVVAAIKWSLTCVLVLDCISIGIARPPGPSQWWLVTRPDGNGSTSFQVVTGLILIIMGGGIRGWCYRALGSFFTWEISIRSNHTLVTTGPYSIVRHPSYVGLGITIAGTIVYILSPDTWVHYHIIGPLGWLGALFQAAYTLWVTAWCVIVAGRTKEEDQILAKAFGKDWEAWASRVRWWYIPFVY